MKKVKNVFTMLAAAALLFLFGDGSLKAAAAEPVTYYVEYRAEKEDWVYRANTPDFADNENYGDMYYMMQALKDGDIVVVNYDGSGSDPALDLGNVHLSNLTVAQCDSFGIIYTGDVDECVGHANGSCAINGNIGTAYLYDPVVCNFNKNVRELRLSFEEDANITSSIGCVGTVGHFYASSPSRVQYDFYNFQADTFHLENGDFLTPSWAFSETGTTAQPTPVPAPAPTPAAGNSSSSSSDEYDHVPKTGESAPVWLLYFAAFCLTGSAAVYVIRRKDKI